MILLWTGQIES